MLANSMMVFNFCSSVPNGLPMTDYLALMRIFCKYITRYQTGPCLPVHVGRILSVNFFLASAQCYNLLRGYKIVL